MKQLTADQVQARKDKAVRFAENVLEDEGLADDLDSESVESYAERKRIEIIPAGRRKYMAGGNGGNGSTKQDLLDRIDELQQANQDLQDQLDAIADIAAGPSEEEDEDDDDQD